MRRFFCALVSVAFLGTVLIGQTLEERVKVIKKVPTTHKVVALTIDDGPHRETTPQVLATLREKNVKATFFVMGKNAEAHPHLLLEVAAEGHEIGNHAYSHRLLTKMNPEEIAAELNKGEEILLLTGQKPQLFRPPGGAYNEEVLTQARNRGYSTILWCIDPGDWRRPSVEQVVNNVMGAVKPGSIILFHDGQHSLPTARAIGMIVDKLRFQGYEFVTVSELLQYYEER